MLKRTSDDLLKMLWEKSLRVSALTEVLMEKRIPIPKIYALVL